MLIILVSERLCLAFMTFSWSCFEDCILIVRDVASVLWVRAVVIDDGRVGEGQMYD
jgi:hypothetical protein